MSEEKKWINDFNEFTSVEPVEVPDFVSNKILQKTHKAMHPPALKVFFKLLGVHSVFGTASLLICDQFGLSPFNTSLSLSEYFMTFGHSVCMFMCGLLFLGFSLVSTYVLLTDEEFKVLKNNLIIQIVSLSILSLSVLVALGAEVSLSIGLLWLLGAFIGGVMPVLTLSQVKA